jgi:predicted nucleic-acid-binding Zn-ribbon protein
MAFPIFEMSEENKKKIIDKLNQKGVKPVCPMCGNTSFSLADGYLSNTIQGTVGLGFVIGGPSIPTVAIICKNCGFTSQHALGALGLLQNKEGGK